MIALQGHGDAGYKYEKVRQKKRQMETLHQRISFTLNKFTGRHKHCLKDGTTAHMPYMLEVSDPTSLQIPCRHCVLQKNGDGQHVLLQRCAHSAHCIHCVHLAWYERGLQCGHWTQCCTLHASCVLQNIAGATETSGGCTPGIQPCMHPIEYRLCTQGT